MKHWRARHFPQAADTKRLRGGQAATVAGYAGPGFHNWPSGHIPQDTDTNPLRRIRLPTKKTFRGPRLCGVPSERGFLFPGGSPGFAPWAGMRCPVGAWDSKHGGRAVYRNRGQGMGFETRWTSRILESRSGHGIRNTVDEPGIGIAVRAWDSKHDGRAGYRKCLWCPISETPTFHLPQRGVSVDY